MKFKIDLKILIFLGFFYFTKQLDMYIIIMIFCFIHEIAHIMVAKILYFKVEEIMVMPFGFFIKILAKPNDCNKKLGKASIAEFKEFFVDIAGPMMNLILAIFFLHMQKYFSAEFVEVAIYSNILIFIFNLIPIFPLDGGRSLQNIFAILFGRKKAILFVKRLSFMVAIIITAIASIAILYIHNIMILFFVAIIWYMIALKQL